MFSGDNQHILIDKAIAEPVSGTSGFGIKRVAADEVVDSALKSAYKSAKRQRLVKTSTDGDKADDLNWVPLSEFYYGKLEGSPTYSETKGEFRFKVRIDSTLKGVSALSF